MAKLRLSGAGRVDLVEIRKCGGEKERHRKGAFLVEDPLRKRTADHIPTFQLAR